MANQRRKDTNPRPDDGTTRPLEKPNEGEDRYELGNAPSGASSSGMQVAKAEGL